jgi:hypothetical protein
MKINTYGNTSVSISTVAELIEALSLNDRGQDIMYTMTFHGATSVTHQPLQGSPHVEFRAWTAPFRNFFKGHVNMDGAPRESRLFQILGTSQEILKAVAPLIEGKVEWQTVNDKHRKVRLWLSRDISQE